MALCHDLNDELVLKLAISFISHRRDFEVWKNFKMCAVLTTLS